MSLSLFLTLGSLAGILAHILGHLGAILIWNAILFTKLKAHSLRNSVAAGNLGGSKVIGDGFTVFFVVLAYRGE